jgi:TPR repeat protein
LGTRGRIFISYRRGDAAGDARGVCERLERKFGKANVFMDVDKLLAGQRFDRELDKALTRCDVLIAVIGPRWMELLADHARGGNRDFVHDEIAAALKRDIVVIPVLIGREGHMPSLPRQDDLPKDIRDLVQYQKHSIAHESFGRDAGDLIAAIKSVLRGRRRTMPWRMIVISSAVGLTLTVALLGYWMDVVSRPGPSPSVLPPHPNADDAQRASQSKLDADRAAADEAARNAAAAESAKKKAVEEAANKSAVEEAQRLANAATAKKKADEEVAGKKSAADCDRLAASPVDSSRPNGVNGVEIEKIDVAASAVACEDAMRRYSDIARYTYQAGRVAQARKDYPKALELYGAASAKGGAASMTTLGLMYHFGIGTAQNYQLARTWYVKAADLGESVAMNNLGELYYYGRIGDQNVAEAYKWYEKAALLGNFQAMFNLGFLCEKGGKGVPTNVVLARKWYQKAADGGVKNAAEQLKSLK